ncbi:hypothetical protein BpHYR1_033570 [Brachionus plicatilis]|uniref:BZIP domain-containing protein n=1 Tax=Brachionus plicatilis TaxID=10195 RepID=A0A3M7RXU7_BRAPC|nr:hypothetical protein BpHYR1_033570 [Brachionus plicatilis]
MRAQIESSETISDEKVFELEQKRKACIISKKYRERKRQQNLDFEKKMLYLETQNQQLSDKLKKLDTIRLMYGFEILKHIFTNKKSDTQIDHYFKKIVEKTSEKFRSNYRLSTLFFYDFGIMRSVALRERTEIEKLLWKLNPKKI